MKNMNHTLSKLRGAMGYLLIATATMICVYLKFNNIEASDFGLVFLHGKELSGAAGLIVSGIFCLAFQ